MRKEVISRNVPFGMGDREPTNQHQAIYIGQDILQEMVERKSYEKFYRKCYGKSDGK